MTDLITGLFIIIEDTISVGDWIEVDGGHAGTVEHLSIRTVRLRDGQGAIHAIPFSQIKIVKNLSRDFAYAVFEVRMSFSTDVDEITQMIREVGADLMADFRYRREMLGPIEVWGLDRFDPNWMVVKGQIKTRPLQQWAWRGRSMRGSSARWTKPASRFRCRRCACSRRRKTARGSRGATTVRRTKPDVKSTATSPAMRRPHTEKTLPMRGTRIRR